MAKKKKARKPKRLYKWILLGGAAIIIAAALLYPYRYRFYALFFSPDNAHYPVRGIDVSHHNGVIDWKAVAGQDFRFAYIKATEGTTFTDPRFRTNCRQARQAGLEVGAYHFFRKGSDGVRQANHMIATIKKANTTLPPVIDVEDHKNDNNVNNALAVKRLRQMVEQLQHAGYRPIIYTNRNGYAKYYKSNFQHIDLWLSSVREPEKLHKSYHHTLQQYYQWSTVDGMKGFVDLNIFMGSEKDWEQWIAQK